MSNLRIMGFGNPLLDISANVSQATMDEWGVKPGDIILADEGGKHKPLYGKLTKDYAVEYIAGGATQNSIRVAQWVMGKPGSTAFVGCVGKDQFGDKLEQAARGDGVNAAYMKHPETPTGTCAVLVKGGERSLVANLSAANCYEISHYETAEIQELVTAANIVYCAGFFLTVSPPTMIALGKHVAEKHKTFCLNLSAPFICQFFKDPLLSVMPYVDFLFGNESEAAEFGKAMGWGEELDVVALKAAAMPKESGSRPRVVVFTQGKTRPSWRSAAASRSSTSTSCPRRRWWTRTARAMRSWEASWRSCRRRPIWPSACGPATGRPAKSSRSRAARSPRARAPSPDRAGLRRGSFCYIALRRRGATTVRPWNGRCFPLRERRNPYLPMHFGPR